MLRYTVTKHEKGEISMANTHEEVDFDSRPPVQVSDYERMVRGVNVGYDLLFVLAHAFLRTLPQPELHLLVVGAGGGAEVERFLPNNPAWRITGVDPSAGMLAQAQAKADALGVSDRVTLVLGTVDDLPKEAHFDAATCIFVLHFLSDVKKLALLRGVAERLNPGAPLVIGTAARMLQSGQRIRDDFLGLWQQHGELMDVPAERMAGMIAQLVPIESALSAPDDHVRLLHEAGFTDVGEVLQVMSGGICAWIAR